MIGFSNKALLALIFSAGAAWPVVAAAPHSTGPGFQESAMDSDSPDQGDMDSVAVEPRDSSISESAVSAPPLDGFGTLQQGNGALPADIWRGSTRDSAEPLLKDIRTGIANDGLRDLVTRLLLSQAAPPQGTGHESWFALRLNALIAIGADDKAEQMISSLPASMTDASMFQLQTSLKLARGEFDKACEKAQPGALPPDDAEEFWRKLSILCLAQSGKQDEATVGLDLMREERHADDPFFQEVIRRIGDKATPVHANPKQWSILNVTALRLANDPEKLKGNMDAFPAVTLKYMAQDNALDTKIRERALARAEALGALPSGESRVTEQPFGRALASDVTTLVAALGSGKAPNEADNAVIARLALSDAGITDSRRVQRLLTLMEPFGYHVPQDVWEKLLIHRERYDGEEPSAAFISRINEAAAGGRRGEIVVLSGLIMAGDEAERDTDLALRPVIKALIAAGFDKEARNLAHSAVKGYGAR